MGFGGWSTDSPNSRHARRDPCATHATISPELTAEALRALSFSFSFGGTAATMLLRFRGGQARTGRGNAVAPETTLASKDKKSVCHASKVDWIRTLRPPRLGGSIRCH